MGNALSTTRSTGPGFPHAADVEREPVSDVDHPHGGSVGQNNSERRESMSPKAKQDMIIAVVVYGIIGFLLAVTMSLSSDSALFPRMVLALMAIVNTVNVWQIISKDHKLRAEGISEPEMLAFHDAKMPLVVFLGSIAYTALFVLTNYFVATAVMIIVYMLIEKVKPKWMILVITALYLAFIYYLFVVQLSVRLIR